MYFEDPCTESNPTYKILY